MPRILTIIFILLLNQTVFSQINMQNTVDAKAFLHEYLTPLGESLGATLNNGCKIIHKYRCLAIISRPIGKKRFKIFKPPSYFF
jgi:hypothetical protein